MKHILEFDPVKESQGLYSAMYGYKYRKILRELLDSLQSQHPNVMLDPADIVKLIEQLKTQNGVIS